MKTFMVFSLFVFVLAESGSHLFKMNCNIHAFIFESVFEADLKTASKLHLSKPYLLSEYPETRKTGA
jgi:hypothetical protein